MRRLRRGLLSAAEVIQEDLQGGGARYRAAMITTTYRPGECWGPRDLSGSLKCLREWARRRGAWVRYVWRLEFTARGVPHYHVLVWLPKGLTMPLWDKAGWWDRGMTNAQWARKAVGYMAKYAAASSDWPPGTAGTVHARWWGCGGMSARQRLRARWRAAPAWLRSMGWDSDTALGRKGSLWRVGPWLIRSPWRVLEVAGGFLQFEWRGWNADSVVIG